jgi:hypothetical protein
VVGPHQNLWSINHSGFGGVFYVGFIKHYASQFARDRRVAFADRACPDLMIDASDIAFNVTSARCIASTL